MLSLLSAVLLSISALIPAPQQAAPPTPEDPYRLVVVESWGFPPVPLAGLDLDVVGPTADGQGLELIAQTRDLAVLDSLGVSYSVTIADLARHYADRLGASAAPLGAVGSTITPAFGQGSMGGYHTFDEVVSILDQLSAAYPQLLTGKFSLGQSVEGRELWAVKLSDNPGLDENEPEVRFDSLHHAREPVGMESTLYFLIWLLENHGTDPLATYLVDEREIWFVPVVNPDGYVYNQSTDPNGGGMWRKNRRDNPGSSVGVDLNRNYPYRWGFDDIGSSPSPFSITYRGPSAASEPETQAMVAFMASRNFSTALSTHAYGNWWLAPWGFTPNLPADDADLDEVGALATANNGFPYGPANTLLYPGNGVTFDTDYGVHGTFAWTPEIGTSSQGFWPPITDLVTLMDGVLESFAVTALAAGPSLRHVGTTLVDLGDGTGGFEPGEEVGVIVTARNSGRGAGTAAATLASNSAGLTVGTASASLGSVQGFTSADNASAMLVMTIDPAATPGAQLSFTTGVDWAGPDETVVGSLTVSAPEPDEWTDLGGGTPGIQGVPKLSVVGSLVVGTPVDIALVDAAPNALMLAWLSLGSTPVPALGGTLHANPPFLQFLRVSDGAGGYAVSAPWPSGLLPGVVITLQFLVQDLSVAQEITLSNGRSMPVP